jgi:rod shape-determining protein MreB
MHNRRCIRRSGTVSQQRRCVNRDRADARDDVSVTLENHGIGEYHHRVLLSAPDVAIDLGTAITRVFAVGRGVVGETPSIVGRTYHPLRRGVIVDIGGAAELLEPLLGSTRRLGSRPRALTCVPSDATADEQFALRQATRAAGAREVAIVQEPLAAAIGAGLDVSSPYAQMLVDIGDGVTDVAVIRSGEILESESLRLGCSDLRDKVIDDGIDAIQADAWMRELCRFDRLSPGMLAIAEQIASFVDDFVRDLPDSVAAEVVESGICATGGGANLAALVRLMRDKSGMTISVAADPLNAVIRGASRIITGRGARTLWAN